MWEAIGSIAGGLIGASATKSANTQNVNMNYDFARNSLKWKTQDAKEAGLHPLAALGAQGYSPTVGVMADQSMGQAVANAGASIANAQADKLNTKLVEAQINAQNALAHKYRSEAMATDQDMVLNSANASALATAQSPGRIVNGSSNNKIDPNAMVDSFRSGRANLITLPNGRTIVTNTAGQSNVQDVEDKYGEIVSLPFGAWSSFIDALQNWSNSPDYKAPPKKKVNQPADLPPNYSRY